MVGLVSVSREGANATVEIPTTVDHDVNHGNPVSRKADGGRKGPPLLAFN
jgi:hypothetical protein